ncbi:MAG: tetratricopeptide repeat protein [Ignavibacteriaceae bacterium]|nr:tetratricopeptide repeat protein [Ignavibacteriaceae bacterium]
MKKIFITVLLFFFFFGQMLAQDKVKAAETAIKKKDYATAMQIAKEFLDIDSALTALRILINVESNNIVSKELFEMIGDSYSKQKVVENALLYYDKAEALDSLDKNIKFKTAELLYKEKRYTDAVNKYLIILSIDSTNTKALYNTANIFYLAKMYPDAALFFDKYLIYEQLNGSYLKAAKSNLESKNYQKAYDYANLASEKDKSEKEVVKIMAVAAAWLGKYDESLSYYAKIEDSTLSKNDIRDLVNAGRNCKATKKDSLALIYFGKVLIIDSTYKDVYWDIAILNYTLANYDTAIQFFDKFLAEKPNFEPAIRFKAFAYLQKKDYNKTREFLLEAIALNDTLVDSYFWLAQSYKAVDSLGRSAEVMEKMITIIEGKENLYRDKLLDAYGFLGQTAYEKKNYGKAIPYFIKALSYKSDNLPFTLMLANCYSILKDTENAKKYYYKVLSLASDRSQEYENAYKSLRAMGELPAKPPRK